MKEFDNVTVDMNNEVDIFPEFVQLLQMLQAEKMLREHKEISALTEYISKLQEQITDMEKQLETLTQNINNTQDKSVKSTVTSMIDNGKEQVSHLRSHYNKCLDTAKSLISECKLKGVNAFKTVLKAVKIDVLLQEGSRLSCSASEVFKTSAKRTALLSNEVEQIKGHASNAVDALSGKAVTPVPKHMQSDGGILKTVENAFSAMASKCEELHKSADYLGAKLNAKYVKVNEKELNHINKSRKNMGMCELGDNVRKSADGKSYIIKCNNEVDFKNLNALKNAANVVSKGGK